MKILIGNGTFFLAQESNGWIGFTQRLSAKLIKVNSIAEGLAMCQPDEISGMEFVLEEVPPFIETIYQYENRHSVFVTENHTGSFTIFRRFDNILVKKTFIGYSKDEALSLFYKEFLNR